MLLLTVVSSPQREQLDPPWHSPCPGGAVSPLTVDTACPDQPEESQIITPEAPEGSPTPGGILSVSPGAPSPTFPGERGTEVRGSPLLMPMVLNLFARMDHLDEVTACHQRMIDVGNYDRHMMRHSLRVLAEIAGLDLGDPRLGYQCPGDH